MKKCFIISPIGEIGSDIRKRSDEILNHIIKPILKEHNYDVLRADEISDFGLITNQIIEHIVYDDLVICDLTSKNPNVYYELAIRHVVQKPIIQIIDEDEELPFDVINTRTIKINHKTLTGADNAKRKIKEYLVNLEKGITKIETPTSRVIDFDITILDKSPINNLSLSIPKVIEMLKEAQEFINQPQNVMSQKFIDNNKEIDKLKSVFLENLSHEIRTPLNSIVGFSDLLKKENISREKIIAYSNVISQNAIFLNNMMFDLLDLSMIESNLVTFEHKEININEKLYNLINYFDNVISVKKTEISINVINPKNTIDNFIIDERKLLQIISKLVDNAIKFTKKGSVEIEYIIKDMELNFLIKDTGIGIAIKDYSIIFEKFKQVIPKEHSIIKGIGLGLPIVKGLIEQMGGRIWLDSQLNIGSTFYFTIPNQIVKKP